MRGLTVGEIAERIQEPGDNLRAVVDRLRSWTKEGLLEPLGDKNPGTGQKKLYPERALVDAAILNKLAKHYGVWASRISLLNHALDRADRAYKEFKRALDRAYKELSKAKYVPDYKDVYLLIGMMEGQHGKPSEPWQIISDIVYVDANRSRPVKAGPPKRDLPIPALMGDGLFINLTSMFKRLGVPFADVEAEERFFKMFPDARRIVRG
jgi:hypothetical protein